MVTSLDKTEEVMGHGVGDAVTETMEFNGTETDVEGKEEAKADEDEFQALTDGEVETVQVDTRDPKNVENEQGGIGDQSVQAEDDEKKKGARKALFKKTTAITMGTSKMRFVQAVLSPRKNAHAKPGKRHGGGDGARQTEDKGPLNPKPSSSKPWIKSQEVLWSDKWWGWGVFHYFLSISSMSISLLLGIGVLWHCFGRWVYVFLVLLVLVLCWNKLGAFIASTISSRSWLIGTVSLFVMYWFIWTLRFWFWDVSQVFGIPKIGYGRSGQMRSLVSSNRRLQYQALVEFGVGVQQRVIGHKGFSGFGYGAQKCVLGNMILLWLRNWDNEIITYYACVYKESRLMVFMCWCNILFLMMWTRSFIICLNYKSLLILFLRDRGITEVNWCWGFRDGLMRWMELGTWCFLETMLIFYSNTRCASVLKN